MKKREQGVLTVEATLALSVFIMLVLFLYNFAGVYRAQSAVSHAAIEAADAVALESYLREVAFESDPQEVVYLASKLGGSASLDAQALESLRSADMPKLAKQKFTAAVGKDETEADTKLKNLGVKDGLAGINFSQCHADLDGDNIIVFAEYDIQMQFPVFGFREIHVTKAAKAKTFGEILYAVSTDTNNPDWGNTSGDNRVDHGSYVEISATPNYGYRFVKWDDGNTDNPRRVLVTDVAKYTAIFEPTNIGVNLYLRREYTDERYRWDAAQEYGTVTGSGEYTYMGTATISATANEHYIFTGWDDNNDGIVDSTENPRQIVVDKTHDITAMYKGKEYTITMIATPEEYGDVYYEYTTRNASSYGSIRQLTVEYKHKVKLHAVAETNCVFDYWEDNYPEADRTIEVLGNATYTAHFKLNTYKVNFFVNNELISTQEVVCGASIEGSNVHTGSVMPADPKVSGKTFDKWISNGKAFTGSTLIKSDTTVHAAWLCKITLDAKGGLFDEKGSDTYTVAYGADSKALPSPIKQGYRFSGWKANNNIYQGGATVKNVTSDITLEAQWSQCKKHVWGRCGETHTTSMTAVLSSHNSGHKTSEFQCKVCIECGAFDGGTCSCSNFASDLNCQKMGAVHLCFNGPSEPTTWGCEHLWVTNYPSPNKVYRIHDEIGMP